MSLIEEWGKVLKKAWSMRFLYVAMALSAAEVAMQFLSPDYTGGRFAALSFAVSMAAAVSRVIAQPRMSE